MTTAHDNDWLDPVDPPSIPPAADAAGNTAIRRVNGQGEVMRFASLVDAMREDPCAGDLDQRIYDASGHALAEVDGRLMVRVGSVQKGYVAHVWLDQYEALQAKAGEPCTVVRVLPEWRFTVAGLERLALENDAERSNARRVA